MRLAVYLFPLLLATAGCAASLAPGAERREGPPNIIILLADDLGYGDLSGYGSSTIHTPNLDRLASEGMRFTRFYTGSAVCSPSRAALLTGRFPLRYNIRRHFNDEEEHLPEAARTLPEVLHEAGYTTAHIGKWHLGGLRPQDYEARRAGRPANPGPLQHGFDDYLTSIEAAPIRPMLIEERKLYREGGRYMVRNDERAPENPGHWTEIKIDAAIEHLETWAGSGQQFFLNLWFDVPHTPYEPAPGPHLSRYRALGAEGDQLLFRSMVSHLDAQIGRLIERLKQLGLYENTLILFTSDNGPAFQGSPGPFRGGKTDLHEGGTRVPFFAVWPGRIPAGSQSFAVMQMVDLLPTLAAAAGVDPGVSGLDGVNRLPVLRGQAPAEHPDLLWQMDLYTQFQNQGPKPAPNATTSVVRWPWKMLADSTGGDLHPTELFNLEQDHRELYNLLGRHPDLERTLLDAIRRFHAAARDRSGAP